MRGPKIMIAVIVLSVVVTFVYCLHCSIQSAWAENASGSSRQQAVNQLLSGVGP